jgi:hypothetical protein
MEILPIDRHSEEVQEILTKIPSRILRWGILILSGVLMLTMLISVFVRYPDTIKVRCNFASSGISIPVVTSAPGRISKMWVKQGAIVRTGQSLASVKVTNSNAEYILTAEQDGELAFVGIPELGASLKSNQIVFTTHPLKEQYFGVLQISPSQINDIKVGQRVLISIKNPQADQYAQLTGMINYIADEPSPNGFFWVKVNLNNNYPKESIKLKSWTIADASIAIRDLSLLDRTIGFFLKGM